MKLSMSILFDELKSFNPKMPNNIGSEKMIYRGVQIFQNQIPPIKDHILLMDSSLNISLPENIYGFIFIGYPDFEISNEICYLAFDKSTSSVELLTEIQKTFLKYSLWEESLYEKIKNNGTIQELCQISEDIFNNPLLVFDNNLLVIALANEMPGLPDFEFDEKSKKLTLPLEILNDFKLDEEFQGTMTTNGTHLYAKHILGCRGLYNNFWVDGKYEGRVCIHELKRELSQKDYCLLDYFSRIINSTLDKNTFHKCDRLQLLEQSIKDLIDGTKINELFFMERLAELSWNRDDSHICIQILIEERDSMTSSLKYTCNRLESNFPNSIAFQYRDSILMIINLSRTHNKISDLMSELKIFLREGLFRAGISMVNNDFFRLRESYTQTTLAVKVGEKIDPMYWYFHFSDYVIQAMFYETSKNISADMYCHPGLFELLRYDKKNETGLFDTLYIFLNSNMNLAHTSEKLFIHRSTLIYRLERINTLISSDLKDPDERFKLLMSYHLLEWNNINAKK